MRTLGSIVIGTLATLTALARPAPALVLGGGAPETDCLVVFDGPATIPGSRYIRCRDGDPCDADGIPDGRCSFDFRLCVNQRGVPGCRTRRIDSVRVRFRDGPWHGSGVIDPVPLPVLDGRHRSCGDLTRFVVPLKRYGRRLRYQRRDVIVTARTPEVRDLDRLGLRCDLNPEGYCPTSGTAPGHLVAKLDASPSGAPLDLDVCLGACDGSTNPVCQRTSAPFAPRADPPPHPRLGAGGIPLCIDERPSRSSIAMTANVATGEIFGSIYAPLTIYLTDPDHVCPRCLPDATTGETFCDGGATPGAPCYVAETVTVGDAVYPLSRNCLPLGTATFAATQVTYFTTGTSSPAACGLPGLAGSATGEPAVPQPPWPGADYPKRAVESLAVTTCTAATGDAQVDGALGLPAAAAYTVSGSVAWERSFLDR